MNKKNEEYLQDIEHESQLYEALKRESKFRIRLMFTLCLVAIIAVAIEVPLFHWWGVLSGSLTIAVPLIFYLYYREND